MSQQLLHNQKALLSGVNRNHPYLRQPDIRLPTVGYANDVLFKKAGTNNCQAADSKLKSLTDLRLDSNQISDIKPLAGLTNLTMLFLMKNPISAKICPVEASACKF